MLFNGKVKDEFNVESITSSKLEAFINRCARIYEGSPDWIAEGDIRTINFAKSIAEETARLATLAIGVTIGGSARAEWLQKQIDSVYFQLTDWVEYAAGYGTIILKPNGDTIDFVLPNRYMVTEKHGLDVRGAVFVNSAVSENRKTFYTRLEYHRFLPNGTYCVTNKCYRGETENDVSKPVAIEKTPWVGMKEEVFIEGLEQPLFAVLKMPGANTVEVGSPLAVPIFANALEELKDLDVAYSRNSDEIYDSSRTVLMDTDILLPLPPKKRTVGDDGGTAVTLQNNATLQERQRANMKLPRYVRNVASKAERGEIYHEINPQLNTAMRKEGINGLLSQIGYKCGFSNGYFVFDERTGMVTATQVEADDRRTIQKIKSVRDQLEAAIKALVYALDKFASLYALAPIGTYEITFDFGDITYNREEDRARWMQYANMNIVPKWKILEKFEGMSEEDAKALVAEAQPVETNLFGAE